MTQPTLHYDVSSEWVKAVLVGVYSLFVRAVSCLSEGWAGRLVSGCAAMMLLNVLADESSFLSRRLLTHSSQRLTRLDRLAHSSVSEPSADVPTLSSCGGIWECLGRAAVACTVLRASALQDAVLLCDCGHVCSPEVVGRLRRGEEVREREKGTADLFSVDCRKSSFRRS